LAASVRKRNNYRFYTENDAAVLEKICIFRHAGLKLCDIRSVIQMEESGLSELLERCLSELNEEFAAVREQQRFIISLLKQPEVLSKHPDGMDKERWIKLMKEAGFTDAEMLRWHSDFERQAPDAHRQFLEGIGLSPTEIAAIRLWSRSNSGVGNDDTESIVFHPGNSLRNSRLNSCCGQLSNPEIRMPAQHRSIR
jgi:hypothetical protein